MLEDTKAIINDYIQAYDDLQKVDVITLQAIERKIDEIFNYCGAHDLYAWAVYDDTCQQVLSIVVNKKRSHYVKLNGGDASLFLDFEELGREHGESAVLKELENFLLRIEAMEGVDNFIRSRTNAPSIPQVDASALFDDVDFMT